MLLVFSPPATFTDAKDGRRPPSADSMSDRPYPYGQNSIADPRVQTNEHSNIVSICKFTRARHRLARFYS